MNTDRGAATEGVPEDSTQAGAMSQGSKLFIYGVKEDYPEETLANVFGRSGQVTDVKNTGNGYAFVTMIDENAAQAAIRDLNGVSIDGGKPIKVSAHKPRENMLYIENF